MGNICWTVVELRRSRSYMFAHGKTQPQPRGSCLNVKDAADGIAPEIQPGVEH